jgi:hypothetical protein
VELTDGERKAVADALDEVAAHLAPRDPRWTSARPRWLDQGELTRPGGRCVFAREADDGLRCALHEVEDATGRPRGALKPLPCRLFPLVVVDLGERRLLTAVHRKTARRLGHATARLFPCLREEVDREPLYRSCRDTLEELFGTSTYRSLDRAARGYVER